MEWDPRHEQDDPWSEVLTRSFDMMLVLYIVRFRGSGNEATM
jgi:hypothetical protein